MQENTPKTKDLPRLVKEDLNLLPVQTRDNCARITSVLSANTKTSILELRKRSNAGALEILLGAVYMAEQAVRSILGGNSTACGKGCSYCCYLKVEAFDFEVYGIVAYVMRSWSKEEVLSLYHRVSDVANRVDSLTTDEYLRLKIPCVFLSESGTCNIYNARPIACVAYHSMDRQECITAHENPDDPWIRQIPEVILGVHGVSIGVLEVVDPKILNGNFKGNPRSLPEVIAPILGQRIRARYGVEALKKEA